MPALATLIGQLARREAVLLGALLLTFAGVVLGLGLSRSYLGYGVETDFIGAYVPEAQRFLDGEPLLSEFHPPLYPLAIAGLRQLVDDWLLAGVVLSVVSGMAVLIVSWLLFHDLGGRGNRLGRGPDPRGVRRVRPILRERQHRCAFSRAVHGQLPLRDQGAGLRVALAVARLRPVGGPRDRYARQRGVPGLADAGSVRLASAVAVQTRRGSARRDRPRRADRAASPSTRWQPDRTSGPRAPISTSP